MCNRYKYIRQHISIVFIIFFMLLLSNNISFANDGILLSVTDHKQVLPGDFFTSVVKIENSTKYDKDCLLAIDLPQSWQLLKVEENFTVKAGHKEAIFLTISVPNNQKAGKYEVSVFLKSGQGEKQESIITEVLPLHGARVNVQSRELLVKADQSFKSNLFIKNLGNVKENFEIKAEVIGGLKLSNYPQEIELDAGEERAISYTLDIDNDDSNYRKVIFYVNISGYEKNAVVSQRITVLNTEEDYSLLDFYWKIPAHMKLRADGGSNKDTVYSGYFFASGNYYDQYWLDINMSSNDLQDGLSSYRFDIGNEKTDLSLGHTYVLLEPLGSTSFEGVRLRGYDDNGEIVIFAGDNDDKYINGIGGEFQLTEKLDISAAIKTIDSDNGHTNFFGAKSSYLITDEAIFEMSAIRGESPTEEGNSYRLLSKWMPLTGYLSGEYYYITPGYPDDISDRQGIKIRGGKRFSNNLYTGAYLGLSKNNLDNNPLEEDLRYKDISLYTSLTPFRKPSLSLGFNYGDIEKSDGITDRDRSYYLGTSYSKGNYSISVGGRNYKSQDYVADIEDGGISYRGRVSYRKNKWNTWLANYQCKEYEDNQDTEIENSLELGLRYYNFNGLSSWLRLSRDSEEDLIYSTKKESYLGEMGFRYRPRNTKWSIYSNLTREITKYELNKKEYNTIFTPGVIYDFSKGLSLGIELERTWGDSGNNTEYTLTIGKDFDLPIIGEREYADLEGNIFIDTNKNGILDKGEQGISKVILKLNDISVLTNEDGKYVFPPLVAGKYDFKFHSLPFGLALGENISDELELERGEIRNLDIPCIEVAAVSGKVYRDNNKNDGNVSNKAGIAGIKILILGDKKYETLTNQDGVFALQVDAGKYKVMIDEATLPNRSVISTDSEVIVDINTGENKEVNFGTYIEAREIIFTYTNK